MVTYGIVGLPNVGKSTLFNALVQRAQAEVSNYPFCTVEPNVSVVPVPDERLEALQRVFHQERVVPATIEVYDIAGLVRGAHRGEGLGNQFLARIREVDALLHVVRCFPDPTIAHVEGEVDPRRDVEIVNTELLLADLATVQRRKERTAKAAKAGDPERRRELEWLEDLEAHLNAGRPARSWWGAAPDQEGPFQWLKSLFLLTAKPVLYVANVGEDAEASQEAMKAVEEVARREGAPMVAIPARLEVELAELPPEEAALFRQEYRLPEAALQRLIRTSYSLLRLITFYTGVGRELRAWTLPAGTAVVEAAGKIHSDMERGFIRAEVVPWDVLVAAGSWQAAKEQGRIAVHGRDYLVQDGDVILIRFHV